MKVPVRKNFQVLPGGRGTNGVSINPGPDTAGFGARQAGAALGAVSGLSGEKVQREQARINEARVRENVLTLRSEIQQAELEYQKFKGAELVTAKKPVMQDFNQRIAKRRNELLDGLNSEDARFAFEQASSELVQRYSERASAYEAEQAEAYIEQQRDGVIVAAFENATRDPARRVDALSTANATLKEKLRDQGYDGDRLRQMSEDQFAKMMSTSVDGLIEGGDTVEARSLLDASRPYLSASAYTIFNEAVSDAENAGQVLTMADQVFADYPPSSFGRSAPLAQMNARARELVGDDPEALKALRSEINYRAQLYEAEAQDAYQNDFDTALSVAMDSPARVSGIGAFRRLDAKDRNSILSMVERGAKGEKIETDRMAYADTLEMIAEGRVIDARNYVRGNPQLFSDSDFRSLMGKATKPILESDVGLQSIRTTNQIIDDAITRAGFKDKQQIALAKSEVRYTLDAAAQDYQRIHGSQPDDAWIQERAEDLTARIVITKPGWWNDVSGRRYEIDSIAGVAPEHVQAVLGVYGDVEQADIEVLQTNYAMAVQLLQQNGVSNPTSADIEDVMTALREQARMMEALQ